MTKKERKDYNKVWKNLHREEVRAYKKVWDSVNKEKIGEYKKAYDAAHRKDKMTCNKAYTHANRVIWNTWLIDHNYQPIKKGYNYHHLDQETKLFNIGSWIWGHPFTAENVHILKDELEKCDYLTRSYHTKLHPIKRR